MKLLMPMAGHLAHALLPGIIAGLTVMSPGARAAEIDGTAAPESSSPENPGAAEKWRADIDLAPSPGMKTRPIEVKWEYSTDGGKTFAGNPPAGAPPNMRNGMAPRAFRGTFEVEDPKAVAGLWVRIAAQQTAQSKPSICTGDLTAASGGYWKDLGHCPTLLNARVLLNGRPVPTQRDTLYFWLPLDAPLTRGKNSIELSGDCYTYWESPAAIAITAALVAAAPQPAKIYSGPQLGDFGDGYFTVACRTQLPADVVLEARLLEPAGQSVTVISTNKIWHRMKVPVPPGTRAVTYTLKARVGPHETSRGPFAMSFPGKEFRFIAMGNLMAHSSTVERLKLLANRVVAARPAFILNTGNISEHGSWDYAWERRFFEPAEKMVATIPTFLTPRHDDLAGIVQEMHCTPAPDMYSHNWSKAIGPVRFIGLNSLQSWKPDGQNTRWLEKELSDSREKFIIALSAYPAFSSGHHSKKLFPGMIQAREVIMPLLAKYQASALISGSDPDYERCEPTPDKGCTQIVIGCSGKDLHRFSGPAMQLNPFSKGKGRDWAGAELTRAILIFDVKENSLEMRCVEMSDDPRQTDEKEFRVIDRKTFQARKEKP